MSDNTVDRTPQSGLQTSELGVVLSTACSACGAATSASEPCENCGYTPPSVRIGIVIDNRYRLDQVLGQGGFGVVYRAFHLGLGGDVAVKLLVDSVANRPDVRARFRREAQALTKMRHPGIVSAIDYGDQGGLPYLVMEFVAGLRFDETLLAMATLPSPARIVELLDPVVEVLEFAHAQGVVHRDLKPENVMVIQENTGRERIKVLDFGLALLTDEEFQQRLTASHAVQGTPLYMSPEQCRGRDVGPPTDIYAFGVMLHTMLSGRLPFEAETAAQLIVQQMFVEPPPVQEPRRSEPGIGALDSLAKRALAKEAPLRPTATQIRKLFREILAGTDAHSQALVHANQRVAAAGMTRIERAIGADDGMANTMISNDQAPAEIPLRSNSVALWGGSDDRARSLRDTLAVSGLHTVRWLDGPVADSLVASVSAVVVVADGQEASRTEMLRGRATSAQHPVVIVDVLDAAATAALIRAGASDVALSGVGDGTLGKKLQRLIKRRRA